MPRFCTVEHFPWAAALLVAGAVLALPALASAACELPPANCCAGDTVRFCDGDSEVTQVCQWPNTCVWNPGGLYMCGELGGPLGNTETDPSGQNPRECPGSTCTPSCSGRQCGDDGCDGNCGTCGEGQICDAAKGTCIADPCADIDPGGCCEGNAIVRCNGAGTGLESVECGAGLFCGTGGPSFTLGCHDAEDLIWDGEPTCDGSGCEPACDGRDCGDDGCGGECGFCEAGTSCNDTTGQCEACTPSCAGKVCGDDGCGNLCGTCTGGLVCNDSGQCVTDPCNGITEEGCCDGSTARWCRSDGSGLGMASCTGSAQCGIGLDGPIGCYEPDDLNPVVVPDECTASCTPDCTGRNCGDDGCGGTCGFCWELGSRAQCDTVTGRCVCNRACSGRQCGNDGCGGSCGGCRTNETCDASGLCQCVPACDGKSCGPDGCAGSCGTCPSGQSCTAEGTCCTPSCAGKACGDDGCGGSCGGCPSGQFCDSPAGLCRLADCPQLPAKGCCDGKVRLYCVNGKTTKLNCGAYGGMGCGWNSQYGDYRCVDIAFTPARSDPSGIYPMACSACVPQCDGKQCGDDGCGGQCGTCGSGEICNKATGQCRASPCQNLPEKGCCAGGGLVTCDPATNDLKVTRCAPIQVARGFASGCGWDTSASKYACGFVGEDPSGAAPAQCPESLCVPNCRGKSCGDDGCGGTCGLCSSSERCSPSQTCVSATCRPDCTGKFCGSDGCGGSCGECASDKTCTGSGQCVVKDPCNGIPYGGCCEGRTLKQCRTPGAVQVTDCAASGDFCGWGGSGYTCNDSGKAFADPNYAPFACPGAPACVPNCNGRTCGPDGCGGSCGVCTGTLQCDNKAGRCVDACQGVPVIGCCRDMPWGANRAVDTCPSLTSSSYRDRIRTSCGYYSPCGYDARERRFTCGGRDTPPADVVAQCPAPPLICDCKNDDGVAMQCGEQPGCGGLSCGTCQPGTKCSNNMCVACTSNQCSTRQCGTDECGVSCGTCDPDYQACSADFQCKVPECGDVTAAGRCEGNTLKYCTGNALVSTDCGTYGKTCTTSGGVSSCSGGVSSCAGRCGQSGGAGCRCDAACVENGNCCSDFEAQCGQQLFGGRCGDGTCQAATGETCQTCPADCGEHSCPPMKTSGEPPWDLPVPQILESANTPQSRGVYAMNPLDDVRPAGPPVPQRGLVAHLPAIGVNAGSPRTGVVRHGGATTSVEAGVQGTAWQLQHGEVQILPEEPLPRSLSYSGRELGGASLAFWVKRPASSTGGPNTIARLWSIADGGEVCDWSRPQDTRAKVSCPAGTTIRSIEAYYGEVDSPAFPDRSCGTYRNLKPTYRCSANDVITAAAQACVGRSSCSLDPWREARDPCSEAPYKPLKSTVMVRAVCDGHSAPAATLLIEPSSTGHRLRFDAPGRPPVRTDIEVPVGQWAHVALTYLSHGGARGDLTLYVNGQPNTPMRSYQFPVAYRWDVGGGTGEADDVYLFSRTLKGTEVRALAAKPAMGLVRVWPSIETERVVRGSLWTEGGKAALLPIEVPHLRDRARTTSSTDEKKLATDHRALRLDPGKTFTVSTRDEDLAGMTRLTLAGWVRARSLTAGTALLELRQGETSQIAVRTAEACSGGGVTATRLGGTALPVGDCAHGLAANEWAFVAYVQDASSQAIFVDGHCMATGAAAGAIFAGDGPRTFRAGDGVDLAWAALFDRALSGAELEAWRSTGPAVWVDGATYTSISDGATQLRDWANFHNNANGAATDTVRLLGPFGGAADATGHLQSNGATVLVPARGRFRPLNGGPQRAFTWSGEVALPTQPPASFTIPLVELVNDQRRIFHAQLRCATVGSSGGSVPRVSCSVDVEGLGTGPAGANYRRWSSAARAGWLAGPPGSTMVAQVAIAFDSAPRVALDFQVGSTSSREMPSTLTPKVSQNGNAVAAPAATVAGAPASGAYFLLPGIVSATPPLAGVGYADLRLYTRALAEGELASLLLRECSDLRCEDQGRRCEAQTIHATSGSRFGAGLQMTACSTCTQAGAGDFIGACMPLAPFDATCRVDLECASGLCGPAGRCATLAESAECTSTCAKRGLYCFPATSPREHYSCNTWFGLPGQCIPGWRSDYQGVCHWSPTLQGGEVCDGDYECLSGVCGGVEGPGYKVTSNAVRQTAPAGDYFTPGFPRNLFCSAKEGCATAVPTTSTVRRCATSSADYCKAKHMEPVARRVTDSAGRTETVYLCERCSSEQYAGRPLYVPRWTMLSPEACQTLYANNWDLKTAKTTNGYEIWEEPTEESLRRLLLLDPNPTSALTPAQSARLRREGVGSVLTGWASLPAKEKARYRRQLGGQQLLTLGMCNRPEEYDEEGAFREKVRVKSAYYNRSLNYTECVSNQFPDGTACPPPNLTPRPDRAHAGVSCESGFCAFDTGKCEEGYRIYEETQGTARNDRNTGGNRNDLGPMQLIQSNQTVLRVAPAASSQHADDRTYSLATTNAYTMKLFDFPAYDVYDVGVTVATQMGPQTATRSERLTLFGLSVPFSKSATVAKCGAVEWQDGEWKKPECRAARSAKGLVEIDATPTVKFEVPIPIGDCKKNPEGTPSTVPQKGKLCWKKTTFVGLVPVTVEIGVALSAAIEYGATIDAETVEPGFKVTPSVGVGLEIKGSVGASQEVGPLEFGVAAGIKAAITLVEIAFPVGWTLKVENIQRKVDGRNEIIPDMYSVKFLRQVDAELTFLKLVLGLFFEVNLGISLFSPSWEYTFFEFEGIRLKWQVSSDALLTRKLDFKWMPQ